MFVTTAEHSDSGRVLPTEGTGGNILLFFITSLSFDANLSLIK